MKPEQITTESTEYLNFYLP